MKTAAKKFFGMSSGELLIYPFIAFTLTVALFAAFSLYCDFASGRIVFANGRIIERSEHKNTEAQLNPALHQYFENCDDTTSRNNTNGEESTGSCPTNVTDPTQKDSDTYISVALSIFCDVMLKGELIVVGLCSAVVLIASFAWDIIKELRSAADDDCLVCTCTCMQRELLCKLLFTQSYAVFFVKILKTTFSLKPALSVHLNGSMCTCRKPSWLCT